MREEAKPAHGFTVACGGEEHLLQAASAAERAEWVKDIRWRIEKAAAEAEAEAAEVKAKAEAEAAEAKAKAEAEAAEAQRMGASGFDSLLFLESKVAVARAAVEVKEQEAAHAKRTDQWEAAKEAAAAAAQLQAVVHSAQERLQERAAWEPLLQAKLEAAEAAKQRLLAADDFDGLPATDAGIAAILQALRCLRMTAEEAGECLLQQLYCSTSLLLLLLLP